MKTACVFIFGLITQCWYLLGQDLVPFNEQELETLADLNFDDIPRKIQIDLLKAKKTGGGDSSHFCCAIDPNLSVGTIVISKIGEKTLIVGTKVSHGTHSCGFFHSKTCDDGQSLQYRQEHVTYIEHVLVPDKADCPDRRVVCCNNFMMIAGQCYNVTTVMQNVDFFKLVASGIFSTALPAVDPNPETVG